MKERLGDDGMNCPCLLHYTHTHTQHDTPSQLTDCRLSLSLSLLSYLHTIILAALSTTAMVLESSLIVSMVGSICIGLGFSSAFLQKRLSELDSMRKLTNQMREKVTSLAEANTRLRRENSRLDVSTKKLKKAESDLEAVAVAQNMGISELVKQVQQYQHIQEQVRLDLKTKIKQTLLSIVMRSDLDQDYTLNDGEVEMLVMRLTAMPDVKFNEAAFRKAVSRCKGSIMTFMNECLTDDEAIAKQKIFEY